VPASRPLQDGLEEAYVRQLLARDDAEADLDSMLHEEVMDVAALVKRKKIAERAGGWQWESSKRVQRMQRTFWCAMRRSCRRRLAQRLSTLCKPFPRPGEPSRALRMCPSVAPTAMAASGGGVRA
jgi:uncharacterized membrane protein